IRPFASSLHRGRRTTPVTSTRRRTIFVSSLMSAIMCTRSTIPESPSCTSVATRLCGGGAPLTLNTAYACKLFSDLIHARSSTVRKKKGEHDRVFNKQLLLTDKQ